MDNRTRLAGRIILVAACGVLLGVIGTTIAQEESSVLVNKPAELILEAPVIEAPPLPPPSNPAKVVAPPATQRDAKQQPRTTARRPFMRPAVPKQQVPAAPNRRDSTSVRLTVAEEQMPAPDGAAPPEQQVAELDVRPAPPIEYDTDGDARDMYRESGQVDLVMVTQNPADGCLYEIPLCVPGCCVGEPTVSAGRGIFGRGLVEYCWSCGFKAEVKFRQILGDVKVEYEGD